MLFDKLKEEDSFTNHEKEVARYILEKDRENYFSIDAQSQGLYSPYAKKC